MVDPNRKINRTSQYGAAFLEECEQEFANRYTEDDKEFAEFKAQPNRLPPIIEQWPPRGNSGNNWNRNNYRPNNRNHFNNRNNDYNRSNYRGNDNRNFHRNNDNRQHYNRPYDRNFRRDGDSSGPGSFRPPQHY